jgi:excisionase family DNA binding protein
VSVTTTEEAAAIVFKALADCRDARVDVQILGELAALRAEVTDLKNRMPPLLARPAKAAKMLDVSLATVKRRIKDGSLPTTKFGDLVLVDLGRVRGIDAAEIAKLAAEIHR